MKIIKIFLFVVALLCSSKSLLSKQKSGGQWFNVMPGTNVLSSTFRTQIEPTTNYCSPFGNLACSIVTVDYAPYFEPGDVIPASYVYYIGSYYTSY